jgi:hypothetical protein
LLLDAALKFIPVIISMLSILISILAFFRGRTASLLEVEKRKQMRVVSARAIVLWEQMQNVFSAIKMGHELDPYIKASMRKNGIRLEESIDKAISLGLWDVVVTSRENSIVLFAAFTQALEDASASEREYDVWAKTHLLMGMVRLLDVCEKYEKSRDGELVSALSSSIRPALIDESWSYLNRQ